MAEKYPLHSVRLDDEVWRAVKSLPKSLNQFLREALSAGGVFEPDVFTPENEARIKAQVTPRKSRKKSETPSPELTKALDTLLPEQKGATDLGGGRKIWRH